MCVFGVRGKFDNPAIIHTQKIIKMTNIMYMDVFAVLNVRVLT